MDLDPSSLSETTAEKYAGAPTNFTLLRQVIFQPGQAFASIIHAERKKSWLFPVLVVSVLIICAALISTFLTATPTTPAATVRTTQSAATTRTVTTNRGTTQNNQLPGGAQGGFPGGEMPPGGFVGGTFPGGGTTTTGTTATGASTTSSSNIWLSLLWPVVSFLITWLLIGGFTNLFSLAFGGASHSRMALGIAAWSSIPIGVRNLAQIVYYLASGTSIQSPGLSGFLTNTNGNALLIFSQFLLARVDIYLFWQVALLAIGVGIWGALSRKKAVVIAVIVIVLVVLLQSLVGLGVNLLGNVNINTSMLLRMR